MPLGLFKETRDAARALTNETPQITKHFQVPNERLSNLFEKYSTYAPIPSQIGSLQHFSD